ncbi:hypothetical protein J7K52_06025 [Candidatus Bathyarchaeota archaeon]|nr:hypothetical protein [Candidatus Bathyarchaeota archaeon]
MKKLCIHKVERVHSLNVLSTSALTQPYLFLLPSIYATIATIVSNKRILIQVWYSAYKLGLGVGTDVCLGVAVIVGMDVCGVRVGVGEVGVIVGVGIGVDTYVGGTIGVGVPAFDVTPCILDGL